MAIPQSTSLLHHLRQTVLRRDGAGLTDGQLLRSFLHHREEAAFEALVRRHGPMVRGVCRRILRNADDADDAFQAVFLVLLRKASALAMREVLGDWLHGVAYRTALKARSAEARRRLKEKQASRREAIVEAEDQSEWLPLLDQEIGRLPEKYRLPVVLCDLQGRTRKEAAQQLGWPEGTLSGRLSRARTMLARRLTRRGVTLSAGAVTMGLMGEASARLPFSLVGSTCKAAMGFAVGSAAGAVPAHVAALTEGVMQAMFLSKLKNVLALGMTILVLTAGVGAWRYAAVAGQKEEQTPNKPIPAAEAARPIPRAVEQRVPSTIPPAPRPLQFDLRIEQVKNGQRKLLCEPRLLTLEEKAASFGIGQPEYPVPQGNNKFDMVGMGPTVRLVAHYDSRGSVCLDMTVSKPTRITIDKIETTVETKAIRIVRQVEFDRSVTAKLKTGDKDQNVLEVTAVVREAEKEANPNTIAAAEKALKMAEFYRRIDHPESARFYYELLRRRYPNTIYAERAGERLIELKKYEKKQGEKTRDPVNEKPPARVGQIFIIGNKKTRDEVILKEIPLFPGQILTFPDLRIAEQKLSRLKGIKSDPKVSVIDREGDNGFKDIQITVEEK